MLSITLLRHADLVQEYSQVWQQAATSSLAAGLQKRLEGQQDPPPQEELPEGQIEDWRDQPC